MMRSLFTTFIMLLAANISPVTAISYFTDYTLVIDRTNWDESDCTTAVNAEIDVVIKDCVAVATGITKLPHRNTGRRRAEVVIDDSTPRDESRRLEEECVPGCQCSANLMCGILGYCSETCGGTTPCTDCGRRVEEQPEFLRRSDGKRELTVSDNGVIKAKCKSEIKMHAIAATHNCLGDHENIDVWVSTQDP